MRSTSNFSLIVAALVMAAFCINSIGQTSDSAEIISKHRASIGPDTALAAIKNQLILSEAQFTYGGNINRIVGKFLILSSADKNLYGMNFTSNDYPQDRFGFDGKNVKVLRSTPTARSLIGDFLYTNPTILKNGLLGGTLSATWPLLDPKNRGAKLKFQGSKTIDGKELLVLSYEPKGGSDLTIRLLFEPGTFRHLRTEYTWLRAAGQGPTIDSSAAQSGTTYRVIEEFSNFTKMGELTLPSSYKINYSRSSASGTVGPGTGNREATWTFRVTDFGINRELDANAFEITDK